MLFKKLELNGQSILRSRYHYDYPLSVKNPLNKEIIVGEVEFYIIESSQTLSKKFENGVEASCGHEERLDQDSKSKTIEMTKLNENRKLIS